MFTASGFRSSAQFLVVSVCGWAATCAAASDFVLTDNRAFPGQLWQSSAGGPERSIFRFQAGGNPAYPGAAMKIAQVAAAPDGKIYFASGLDGYVLHLLNDRQEVVSFEVPGQIRDLDCGGEEHVVYFSVVPTPQNGAALADGKIYRRDLWAGQPSEVATVRQADIGGNWWGTFAIHDGTTYLATFETPSRIFKLTTAGAERVFASNRAKIHGLATDEQGNFYFVDGTDSVYRTRDFDTVEAVLHGGRPWTDVAVEPSR
jgi:hypothetical protein